MASRGMQGQPWCTALRNEGRSVRVLVQGARVSCSYRSGASLLHRSYVQRQRWLHFKLAAASCCAHTPPVEVAPMRRRSTLWVRGLQAALLSIPLASSAPAWASGSGHGALLAFSSFLDTALVRRDYICGVLSVAGVADC